MAKEVLFNPCSHESELHQTKCAERPHVTVYALDEMYRGGIGIIGHMWLDTALAIYGSGASTKWRWMTPTEKARYDGARTP